MIDSSAFNDPGMDLPEDYRKGSYVPQYAAATRHKQQQPQQQEQDSSTPGTQHASTDATARSISTPVGVAR